MELAVLYRSQRSVGISGYHGGIWRSMQAPDVCFPICDVHERQRTKTGKGSSSCSTGWISGAGPVYRTLYSDLCTLHHFPGCAGRILSHGKRKRSRSMSIRQYWFVLWELTKRELKRKYARSFLGILWSCVYPLMRMALVVVLFSTIFNKGIDKYPAYYFVGFLMFEFFATATQTSLTTLKDNRDLLIKSKLPRELFVLSRVLTAFVNFLLGCIPFAAVLAWYRASVTVYYLMIPIVLLLLLIFTTGVSYAVSIWFVFQRDAGNIYSNFIFILRFFVAMFYSVDWVAAGVRWVIEHNPVYLYIYILRQCVVYGQRPEWMYVRNGIIWAAGMFGIGILVFKKYENEVVERL